jgi:hypothetical protein
MPKFKSTAIKRAEYDREAMRLTIWFPEGHTTDFCNVPIKIWDGLLSARSKGSFYNLRIKDQFPC